VYQLFALKGSRLFLATVAERLCTFQRRRYVTDVLYFLYPDLLHLHSANQNTHGEANLFTGTVIVPSSDKPENMHASSLNHHRYVPKPGCHLCMLPYVVYVTVDVLQQPGECVKNAWIRANRVYAATFVGCRVCI
jgi:hypothetical protein